MTNEMVRQERPTPIPRPKKASDEDIAMRICDHPEEGYTPKQQDWAMDFLQFNQPPYREQFDGPFVPNPQKKYGIQPAEGKTVSWSAKIFALVLTGIGGIGIHYSLSNLASAITPNETGASMIGMTVSFVSASIGAALFFATISEDDADVELLEELDEELLDAPRRKKRKNNAQDR